MQTTRSCYSRQHRTEEYHIRHAHTKRVQPRHIPADPAAKPAYSPPCCLLPHFLIPGAHLITLPKSQKLVTTLHQTGDVTSPTRQQAFQLPTCCDSPRGRGRSLIDAPPTSLGENEVFGTRRLGTRWWRFMVVGGREISGSGGRRCFAEVDEKIVFD